MGTAAPSASSGQALGSRPSATRQLVQCGVQGAHVSCSLRVVCMWRGRPRPRTVRSVTLLGPMPRRSQPLRIAIDTGGTFTDCVWMEPDRGRLRMLKVFSTPADPSQAIVEALRQITEGIAKEEEKTDKAAPPENSSSSTAPPSAPTRCSNAKARAPRSSPPPDSKTPSKSDARPAPSSTTFSSTASSR